MAGKKSLTRVDTARRARNHEHLDVIVNEDAELLARLAGLEDDQDLADAREALEDPANSQRISWDDVKAGMDL